MGKISQDKMSGDQVELVRSAYIPHRRIQYTGELLNHKTGELYKPVTRVKQSFVAECDINNILKQYSATGQLKHISARAQQGAYRDLPDEVDFQYAQNVVAQASQAFATLPSRTRDRFNNDPVKFLEFMSDPENAPEAIRLGLATAKPTQASEGPQARDDASASTSVPEGSETAAAA